DRIRGKLLRGFASSSPAGSSAMISRRLLLLAVLAWLGESRLQAGEPLKRFEFSEPHMGTRFRIIIHARNRAVALEAAKAAFARVVELNGIMSDYQSTSELMRLCAKAGGAPVKVSGDLLRVLARAQK